MFHLALSDINKNYLTELKNMGFKVDGDDLEHLAHMGPSLAANVLSVNIKIHF